VGGWTAAERYCWMYGVRETGWGGRLAIGAPGSATATLPDVAHGATREQSEGGQCEQSWFDPRVHEGVANRSESWLAWVVELEATEAWLSQ
jgi:hypothetical protein